MSQQTKNTHKVKSMLLFLITKWILLGPWIINSATIDIVYFIISTIQEGIRSGKFILLREQFGPLNPVPPQSHSLLTILFTHFPPLWHFPPKLGSLHASRHPGMVRSLFNKRTRRNFLSPVANLGAFIQPSNLREKMISWSLWNWFYLFALFPLNLFIIYLYIFHTGRIWKWRFSFSWISCGPKTFWTQKNRPLPKWWRQW